MVMLTPSLIAREALVLLHNYRRLPPMTKISWEGNVVSVRVPLLREQLEWSLEEFAGYIISPIVARLVRELPEDARFGVLPEAKEPFEAREQYNGLRMRVCMTGESLVFEMAVE